MVQTPDDEAVLGLLKLSAQSAREPVGMKLAVLGGRATGGSPLLCTPCAICPLSPPGLWLVFARLWQSRDSHEQSSRARPSAALTKETPAPQILPR